MILFCGAGCSAIKRGLAADYPFPPPDICLSPVGELNIAARPEESNAVKRLTPVHFSDSDV
jgi:hypothetical protein